MLLLSNMHHVEIFIPYNMLFYWRNAYFCTMKKLEFQNEEMNFGLYLCTQGDCEMTINGNWCKITHGSAFVKSPLVQINHIIGSDDFEFATIMEDEIAIFAPMASNNFDIIQHLLHYKVFGLQLDDSEQIFLLDRKRLIDERKSELQSSGLSVRQKNVIRDIVVMIEQVTVLEYARMFLGKEGIDSIETKKENDLMIRFIFLLFQNYVHHREVGFYADALNLSRNHFTRLIKKVSGRSPSEWIALVTINQAKKLLRQRDLNIKEVALSLSFPEQFTFRKYFKQHTGMSPTEYKSCV